MIWTILIGFLNWLVSFLQPPKESETFKLGLYDFFDTIMYWLPVHPVLPYDVFVICLSSILLGWFFIVVYNLARSVITFIVPG